MVWESVKVHVRKQLYFCRYWWNLLKKTVNSNCIKEIHSYWDCCLETQHDKKFQPDYLLDLERTSTVLAHSLFSFIESQLSCGRCFHVMKHKGFLVCPGCHTLSITSIVTCYQQKLVYMSSQSEIRIFFFIWLFGYHRRFRFLMWLAKALVCLCRCTGRSEPLLAKDVIKEYFSCPCTFHVHVLNKYT